MLDVVPWQAANAANVWSKQTTPQHTPTTHPGCSQHRCTFLELAGQLDSALDAAANLPSSRVPHRQPTSTAAVSTGGVAAAHIACAALASPFCSHCQVAHACHMMADARSSSGKHAPSDSGGRRVALLKTALVISVAAFPAAASFLGRSKYSANWLHGGCN